jgi:hypothetical protein
MLCACSLYGRPVLPLCDVVTVRQTDTAVTAACWTPSVTPAVLVGGTVCWVQMILPTCDSTPAYQRVFLHSVLCCGPGFI